MEMRRAGKTALNAGRYYLKCPSNGRHPGSFKWYDEYIGGNETEISAVEQEAGSLPTHTLEHSSPELKGTEHKGSHCFGVTVASQDARLDVMIAFMGLLLVVIGVLIGKLM